MPNKNKCDAKQPCNAASDNSEVCYKVQCEPKCEQDCCIKKCDEYRPEEIVCLFKDAVVEIQSEFILFGASGPTAGSANIGATPLGANSRADIIQEGNGFFIKGHYIVAPAHLVLLPPSLTSVAIRYPFDGSNQASFGQIQSKIVRASRILVSVYNVNGKGHAFVYEADLVGVDGAGDIAVLRINFKKQWNLCNPCVEKCHPYFNFGSSRGSKDGEKVYLLGDYLGSASGAQNAVGAISDGLLSDHRHLDYSGAILPELVLISAPAYSQSSGLPILNAQGQVIGMQTTDLNAIQSQVAFNQAALAVVGSATGGFTGTSTGAFTGTVGISATGGFTATFTGLGSTGSGVTIGEVLTGTGLFGLTGTITGTVNDTTRGTGIFSVGASGSLGPFLLAQERGFGFVSGPSEFFMRRVIKELIKGTCSRKFNCQLETICDPLGSFYSYMKAYAGLAYKVFTGIDYDITVNYTSGAAPNGRPRVRLTATGAFLSSPSCKEIIGIKILGIAGLNPNDSAASIANGFYFVPGGTAGSGSPLANNVPVSPFLNKLQPGDVITHINGVALGDLDKQIAPSLITWRLCENDQIEICYRRGGNFSAIGSNDATENYDNLYTNTGCLIAFPALLDYPWYAINKFPLLSTLPYPGFVFPNGQSSFVQYPSLAAGAPFRPAF